MGDGNDSEHAIRGLSAGQMVMLFLAGAAVCAIFFSAGFVVGYNEKSSKAAPLTEQVPDSTDIPPVIGPDPSRAPAQSGPAATPKIQTPATDGELSEPLRPRQLAENQSPPSQPNSATKSPEAPNGASSYAPAGGAGAFMIQVAATGTKADGDKLVKALRSLNYPAVLLTPEQVRAGDSLFRIQVGPFSTKESAEKTKARLMQDGFKQPFIKH